MSDIQEYKISINFSTKNADKAKDDIDKVKKSVSSLKGTTTESKLATAGIGKLTSSFGGLTKMLKGFVAVKTFTKLGETIFSLGGKMADYIETVNLFRTSMGDAADQAQEFIDKAEKLLGMDPSSTMKSISQFYNLAEGFGIASDRAYTMSQNLTQLAGDLSSVQNISFEAAQQKLMSGFAGQTKPLREYGIALEQANLQETAYALGLDQKVKNMTRAQKTELIYYQIMSSTQKMQGDLGRSLLSPANSIRVMQTEFKALARAVGSIFIPIMMKIIPVVRAVTQILTQAAQAIASFFGFKMSDFNADLGSVGNLLTGVSDDIDGVGDAAEDTTKKLNKMLMPFDELNNVNFDTGSAGSGAGAGAGVGSGGSLGIELPEYDMFASMSESMDGTINKIKEKLSTLFEPIRTSWELNGQGVMESMSYALEGQGSLIGNIGKSFETVWTNGTGVRTLNTIFSILTSIFNIIGNIGTAFSNAWTTDNTGTIIIQNLWDSFNNLLEIIEITAQTFESFTKSEDFQRFAIVVTEIIRTVSEMIQRITETAKKMWEEKGAPTLKTVMETFSKMGEIIGKVFEILSPILEVFFENNIKDIGRLLTWVNDFMKVLVGVLDFISGIFTGDWNRALNGIWTVFTGTIDGIIHKIQNAPIFTIFVGIFERARDTIQGILEKIKGFFKFEWEFPKLKTPHIWWGSQPAPEWIGKILRAINLPDQIPKMNVEWYANGGFPSAGELFFMNEAGPEMIGQIGNRTAVANQDQITTAIANATYNAISRALAENRSNDQPAVIQVNLGNEELYKGYGQYKNEQSNMYGITL